MLQITILHEEHPQPPCAVNGDGRRVGHAAPPRACQLSRAMTSPLRRQHAALATWPGFVRRRHLGVRTRSSHEPWSPRPPHPPSSMLRLAVQLHAPPNDSVAKNIGDLQLPW